MAEQPEAKTEDSQPLTSEYDIVPPGAAPATDAPAPASPPRGPDGKFISSKPKHTDRMTALARQFGVPQEEIDEMNAQELRERLRDEALERRITGLQQAVEQSREAWLERLPLPEPSGPAPVPEPGLGLDEQHYDPGLLGALKSLHKRVDSLEKENAFLKRHLSAQAELSNTERIDAVFASWGDDRFGTGPVNSLKPDAPELAKRNAIVTEAYKLAGPKATLAQALARAEEARDRLFGKKEAVKPPPLPEATEESVEARQWREAALARPTHRAGAAEPNGYDKAVNGVNEYLKTKSAAQTRIADEFPG